MNTDKVEKLASSEIAQSRERSKSESLFSSHIGPVFGPVGYDFDDSQREKIFAFTDWCIDKAERYTRERCAQELKEVAGEIGSHVAYHIEEMYPGAVKATPKSFLLSVRNFTSNKIAALAERIRGKE